ncbi:MAG TPA: glycosyltransferase [Myxococcota bacterium]|nr:glycosyltransferase [Myxococcota bacterium]
MIGPRVLVTAYPQSGHLHPLIPTARALVDAGCSIVVATSASQRAGLASAGFETIDLGPSHDEAAAQLGKLLPTILAMAPPDRRPRLFSFLFGEVYAAAIADELLERARSLRPDLILSGLESLAGPLVAARLELPLAVTGFGLGLPHDVCEAAMRAVAPLWKRAGLDVPARAGVFDGLYVDACPASLRPDDVPVAPRCQPVRPAQFDGVGELPPLPTRRPLVYVSFGTNRVFATPKRLRTIAEAIAALGAGAVITGCDPGELGTVPDGVAAHGFVPQSLLLPHCDAAICHAGANTAFGALAKGVPLVMVPLGADHFTNTRAVVRRGAALALDEEADSQSIAAALERVLRDREIRTAAREVAEEIAAMPSPAAAADGILSWLHSARSPL